MVAPLRGPTRFESVDVHAHLCPDQIAAQNLAHMEAMSGVRPACQGTVHDLLTAMDRGGIAQSLVTNLVLKPEVVGKANDWTAQVVRQHPDRLLGMGWIHPAMTNPAAEVARCFETLGFHAIKLHCSNVRIFPEDRRLTQVYEQLVRRDAPALVHCGPNVREMMGIASAANEPAYSHPQHFATVLASFPKLRLILGHLGGGLFYWETLRKLLAAHEQVVVDTALSIQPERLMAVLDEFGSERMLFGSDYPVVHPASEVEKLSALPISPATRTRMLRENATRVLGLAGTRPHDSAE